MYHFFGYTPYRTKDFSKNKRNKGFVVDLALVAITMMAIGTIAVLFYAVEKLSES